MMRSGADTGWTRGVPWCQGGEMNTQSDLTSAFLTALVTFVVMAVLFLRGWDKGKAARSDGDVVRRKSRGAVVLGCLMLAGGAALIVAGAGAIGWLGAGLGLLLALRNVRRRNDPQN